jgi:hypothetical protein
MMHYNELVPAQASALVPHADRLRLAVAADLARFKGTSRDHTDSDLRCYLAWCAEPGLDPFLTWPLAPDQLSSMKRDRAESSALPRAHGLQNSESACMAVVIVSGICYQDCVTPAAESEDIDTARSLNICSPVKMSPAGQARSDHPATRGHDLPARECSGLADTETVMHGPSH